MVLGLRTDVIVLRGILGLLLVACGFGVTYFGVRSGGVDSSVITTTLALTLGYLGAAVGSSLYLLRRKEGAGWWLTSKGLGVMVVVVLIISAAYFRVCRFMSQQTGSSIDELYAEGIANRAFLVALGISILGAIMPSGLLSEINNPWRSLVKSFLAMVSVLLILMGYGS